ncbi:MAG: hypothetical protein M1818_005623 [Claussenomyces sp. TS43310]|nr:MAG: hypothetical protein M1818_005623 [Claussenomyces sp. TS43310]
MTNPQTPRKSSHPHKTWMSKIPVPKNSTVKIRMEDRRQRTSFASFKEEKDAIAQTFVDSKISSYANAVPTSCEADDEAVTFDGESDDATQDEHAPRPTTNGLPYRISQDPLQHQLYHPRPGPSLETAQPPGMTPLTNPSSMLHGFVCPCEGFQGWKAITVGGKKASKSFSDLRASAKGFSWEPPTVDAVRERKKDSRNGAGASPFERLPIEILDTIIDYLVIEIPPNGFGPRNMDLMSLLLTSHALHSVTLATLYKAITIPHSKVFRKFLSHVASHPALGTIVRRLDFSHYNPTGAGLTARERAETLNLTRESLLQCMKLLPNLREFLAQEHIDEELSTSVIRTLLDMPDLKALDFCACSAEPFRDAMLGLVQPPSGLNLPDMLSITRLSLHECTILPAVVLEAILPRLTRLTHLDVAHTQVTDRALANIPDTARLTHLNLSKCSSLDGFEVVQFLTYHPAVKDTLVYLNLMSDARSHELLGADHVTSLLPALPTTLRSLNLKGSSMCNDHIKLLRPFVEHLEELSVGRSLRYEDLASLLLPMTHDQSSTESSTSPYSASADQPVRSTLKYLDMSDMSKEDLDLMTFFSTRWSLLTTKSWPLEVIEVSNTMHHLLKAREGVCESHGWRVREAGRRSWLVRDLDLKPRTFGLTVTSDAVSMTKDDGVRAWKMGATYWGMRKIPVVKQEVGGMYGLYMFKR